MSSRFRPFSYRHALGVVICCAAALLGRPAGAFDTGHHADLTREALAEQRFSEDAIRTTQLQNWLVDYFSSSPVSRLKDDCEKLHFDHLYSTGALGNYWGRLAVNTKEAAQQAAREKNSLKLLTVLGGSLHAVQDFYTHSNWVETHPRGADDPYRSETWFSAGPGDAALRTGRYPNKGDNDPEDHGDYNYGMNHDSYQRPRWDEAYTFAYVASREWTAAVKSWVEAVDPEAWSQAVAFGVEGADRKALDADLAASYRVSEWVALSGANGHWKGSGSGSNKEFIAAVAGWAGSPDSRFVTEFKERKTHLLLSRGLTDDGPPSEAVPAIAAVPLNVRAVLVRTLRVQEKDDVGTFELKIDSGGKADFFAQVTVAGQTFIEAMQTDKPDVSPFWTTLKFVPADMGQVPVRYELWDEDGGLRGDDDHCDINPAGGAADLNFSFAPGTHGLSGDLSGVHDSDATAIQSAGAKPDKDRAVVRFYVTERAVR